MMLVFNWLLVRDQAKHEILPCRLAFFPSANFTLRPKRRPPTGPIWMYGVLIYPQQNYRSRKNGRLRTHFFCYQNSTADLSKSHTFTNGTRWRTMFFRHRTSRCLQNFVRQRVPFDTEPQVHTKIGAACM